MHKQGENRVVSYLRQVLTVRGPCPALGSSMLVWGEGLAVEGQHSHSARQSSDPPGSTCLQLRLPREWRKEPSLHAISLKHLSKILSFALTDTMPRPLEFIYLAYVMRLPCNCTSINGRECDSVVRRTVDEFVYQVLTGFLKLHRSG